MASIIGFKKTTTLWVRISQFALRRAESLSEVGCEGTLTVNTSYQFLFVISWILPNAADFKSHLTLDSSRFFFPAQ